jgi:hypothetical protein
MTKQTRRPWVLDAALFRNVDDSEPEEWIDWTCEYELRDDGSGIDDSGNPDLRSVVDGVIDYARSFSDRYDLTIEWTVSGDPPPGGTVQDAIAALGVVLPTRLEDPR